jgi:ribonuclease HII
LPGTALVVFLEEIRVATLALLPTLSHETRLWRAGCRRVAGLDEAGRGAWAGPVVAAAVILPPDEVDLLRHLAGVRDSKQLTAARRETLWPVIVEHALAWGVGVVGPAEIDAQGIVPATCRAMARALAQISPAADHLLIDHLSLPELSIPQTSLTRGDVHVLSIAAASILAKVHRDRLLVELADQHPGYGFARHKGYGTPQHRQALADLGPCPSHRLSFAPLRDLFVPSE